MPERKKDLLFYFFSTFYYVGFFLCWVILIGILDSLFGQSSILMSVLSLAAMTALGMWVRKIVRDRENAETVIREFEIAVDGSGIRIFVGRTVTYYSWDDIKSISADDAQFYIAIVGEEKPLRISREAFEGAQGSSEFEEFVKAKMSGVTVGNA